MNPNQNAYKFLFVIDNLSTGGAQRQMVNLAVGLKKRGYQIEVFCYSLGDLLGQPLKDLDIPVHQFQKKGRFSTDVIFTLRNLIHHEKYDLLLSFLTTPNFYTLLAGSLSGLGKIPMIVSERFCDLPGNVSKIEQVVRQVYRLATFVVTNSHHQRINLSKKNPNLRGKLRTIYNGYDLQTFRPPETEPGNTPLHLLTIASVSRYKNGLCLVEALKELREKYRLKSKVDWIGQRVLGGDRLVYLREMEKAIQYYGLQEQWRWLDQRLDIVNQLHQHDLLVHPSYGEGLPNVVCEALACGRPILLSKTLDHANLIQDGVSGFLFDYTKPSQLAEKIKQFDEMTLEERRWMGQNGRQFAEKNLGVDRYINEYEELLHISLQGEK